MKVTLTLTERELSELHSALEYRAPGSRVLFELERALIEARRRKGSDSDRVPVPGAGGPDRT